MLIVSIIAADGYEYANEVTLAQLDRYLDLVVAVLQPGEGVVIRGCPGCIELMGR